MKIIDFEDNITQRLNNIRVFLFCIRLAEFNWNYSTMTDGY